jgi:hypothetical protein
MRMCQENFLTVIQLNCIVLDQFIYKLEFHIHISLNWCNELHKHRFELLSLKQLCFVSLVHLVELLELPKNLSESCFKFRDDVMMAPLDILDDQYLLLVVRQNLLVSMGHHHPW